MNKRTKKDQHQRNHTHLRSTSLSGTSLARGLEGRPALRQQMVDGIVGNPRSSYLLASLYIKDVASGTDVEKIEDALLDLPLGLDEVYQDKLKRF